MKNVGWRNRELILLQVATIGLLVGWAWLHWTTGGPYRAFFLNDYIMRGFAERVLGMNWGAVLSDLSIAMKIKAFGQGVGLFFLLSSLLVAFIRYLPKRLVSFALWLDAILLIFMAFCLYLDKGRVVAQFLEYTLQFCTPLFLWAFLYKNVRQKRLILALKVAIAFTFISHGLYAIGYYPRPGYFTDMVIQGFKVQEDTAVLLLKVVGYLDIVASIGLFIPSKLLFRSSLYYIILWGFMTAIARVVSNVHFDIFWYSLMQWLPAFLVRMPHFLLPVFLLWLWKKK